MCNSVCKPMVAEFLKCDSCLYPIHCRTSWLTEKASITDESREMRLKYGSETFSKTPSQFPDKRSSRKPHAMTTNKSILIHTEISVESGNLRKSSSPYRICCMFRDEVIKISNLQNDYALKLMYYCSKRLLINVMSHHQSGHNVSPLT